MKIMSRPRWANGRLKFDSDAGDRVARGPNGKDPAKNIGDAMDYAFKRALRTGHRQRLVFRQTGHRRWLCYQMEDLGAGR